MVNWQTWKMKHGAAQHLYVPHAFVKIEFSFNLLSSSLCFEAIFSPAVCSSTWIFFFRWWNRDLSSRSSFLSSSFPSAFYSTLLPLQSSMLHGVLSNYANAALAGDQDTGGEQDHSLKQLSSLWSTVINIPVCVCVCVFFLFLPSECI